MLASMRSSAAALALLLGAVVSACGGGSGGGGDLTGKVDVPDGYVLFNGSGVSFAFPAGWKVDQTPGADGATTIAITAPNAGATPGPLIQLTIVAKGGDRFKSFVEQRRVVAEQVNGGKLDSEDEVTVRGAKRALRTTTTTPKGRGTDPVEVKSAALEAISDANDIVVLTAADPQRDGSGLDPDAVIDSFRFVASA